MSSIYSFAPASAYAGDVVQINGHLFTGATSVTFGGVEAASFVVDDDGTIHAIVGNGGATGAVGVAGPAGSAANIGFTFLGTRSKKRVVQVEPLGRMAAAGDLLMGWDGILGKTRSIDIAELPFTDGGGGGMTTVLGSPFKVRITSASYSFVGGNTVITDARLIGKSDYVVTTTQLNLEFRDADLVYDAVAGTVTINNFELQDLEHITIYADGVQNSAASDFYASIRQRITLLEQIAAPYFVTVLGPFGGKVFWGLPANQIPAGWQEYTAMRGKLPFAQDPDDMYDADTNPDGMSRAVGNVGGSKTHTNTLEEMVPHTHPYTDERPKLATDFGNGSTRPSYTTTESVNKTTGSTGGDAGAAKPYSILNPYRIVMWIEFIGV